MAELSPGARLEAMRAARPLVHNITNFVAMNFMANVLLAAGAVPAMVHAAEEAREFAARADALTINIGTLSPGWIEGMVAAIEGARGASRPWVLDPVAAGSTAHRTQTAATLAALAPTVIRANASEVAALSGEGKSGRGPQATADVAVVEAAARSLARRTGAIVAVTGAIDYATDGTRVARVANGHPLMPLTTASGCALTGILGAFLAASKDAFASTIAALAFYGRAGEIAGKGASGPGSFAIRLIDALAALDGPAVDASARITFESPRPPETTAVRI